MSVHEESSAMGTHQPAEAARSFYLLEESMCVIGEIGYFRPYATTEELHARLEPKLSHEESCGRLVNDFLLGESVNVWTVQRGRLAAGLDVTEFVSVQLASGIISVPQLNRHRDDWSSRKRADPPPEDEGAHLFLDWDGIIARLQPLEAPHAVLGDADLAVRLDGPRPAPEISSYIDELIANLAKEDLSVWSDNLSYGSPFTV